MAKVFYNNEEVAVFNTLAEAVNYVDSIAYETGNVTGYSIGN